MEFMKKAIQNPKRKVPPWTTMTAGHEWLLPPWKCPFERDLPWGGRRDAFKIQEFSTTGETVQPHIHVAGAAAGVRSGQKCTFLSKKTKPRVWTVLGSPASFRLEVLSGETCWLSRAARSRRASGGHRTAFSTRPEGPWLVTVVQERTAAVWPCLGVVTVKASVH